MRAAQSAGIELQLNGAGTYTSTDADTIMSAGAGCPTGLISIPTRYLHSPAELVDLADAEACIELICEWLETGS
jgi:endoglucanase